MGGVTFKYGNVYVVPDTPVVLKRFWHHDMRNTIGFPLVHPSKIIQRNKWGAVELIPQDETLEFCFKGWTNKHTWSAWEFHPEWLEYYKPPIVGDEPPECVCISISAGCSCGAFEIEMQMKGYTQNPVTRLWEPNEA